MTLTEAELAEIKSCRNNYHPAHPMGKCIDDLLAMVRELKRDAERYRWLREQLYCVLDTDAEKPFVLRVEFEADISLCDKLTPGEACDHYADAAMSAPAAKGCKEDT